MDGQPQKPGNRQNCKVKSNDKSYYNQVYGIAGDSEHYNEPNLGSDELIKMNKNILNDEYYDNGGGMMVNNSMHVTNSMCYTRGIDMFSVLDYSVNSSSASAGNRELCSVNRMFIKVHDSEGLPSHMLSLLAVEEHRGILGHNISQNHPIRAKLSILGHVMVANGHRANIAYVHDQTVEGVGGYYYLIENVQGLTYSLFHCAHPPEGYLEVIAMMNCYIIQLQCHNDTRGHSIEDAPEVVYDNYLKDLHSWKNHGCSYESHVADMIDEIIDKANEAMLDTDRVDTMDTLLEVTPSDNNPDKTACRSHDLTRSVNRISVDEAQDARHDFNYHDKEVGYLSLSATDFEFIGPDKEPVCIDSIEKLIPIANSIRASGLPNYRAVRIPIKSGLNVEAWERHLKDYEDKRVVQYIKFGFPLSLNNPHELNNTDITNHYSACQHPQQVQQYINKEIKLGALLGPVNVIDHEHFHCSPLLTRPKDVNKRRVILNLSYPYECSVNSHVDKNSFDEYPFTLKFPTVDHIARDILECTQDPVLFKVDIARAFRNLRVDPADSLKLGIKWKDAFFVDAGVAFGWTHGSTAFQILSDAIAFIMRKEGANLRCYIDDYIAVLPSTKADHVFQRLCALLDELGLPINYEKLTPPTKKLSCLGIDIDIDNNTMSIAEDKLKEIYAECIKVSTKTAISKRHYQSLLGKLLYIHKCVRPARVFVNRILATFRANASSRSIHLSEDFQKDIQWFLTFLPAYNGVSYICKQLVDVHQSLHLDASLTGMGAVWRDRVYATPIHNCADLDLKIIHLEMLNIVIALRTWGHLWRHSVIKIFCDNLGVVQVVETGKTRDTFLGLCIRNVWLITATWDIQLQIKQGVHNVIADTLSRVYSDKPVNLTLLQELQEQYVWEHIPGHYFNLNLQL